MTSHWTPYVHVNNIEQAAGRATQFGGAVIVDPFLVSGIARIELILDSVGTVVGLVHGYASTAIAPIESFHSAGVVWNWLHGETERPRFRVRTASVDGRKVSAAGSLALIPDYAIKEIKHTDIILIAAPGWDELDRIARDTP